jgi:hypothetical protein
MKETPPFFDHEKLVAYQRSIEFVAWSADLLEAVTTKLSVSDQLDVWMYPNFTPLFGGWVNFEFHRKRRRLSKCQASLAACGGSHVAAA